MHDEVKKYADAGDVKSLKYIFDDCLDVDPTFEKYLDDYNYCAKKGLFEPHKNLSDFSNRQADWNENYWQILKRDLLKNFSRERLDHMRKVALVVLADKVARLQRERQQQNRQPAAQKISQPPVQERPASPPPQSRPATPLKSKAEQQREELEAERQKLAQANAEFERQQKLQQQELDRQRQENLRQQKEVTSPKKATGTVLWKAAIAAGAALAAMAMIIYNALN